ncbi:hypothetical protein [Clostridium sp.]|uniref:hypothetical protein n=1 Tax=Clostridium sp. TaxID=1506 RepID=UPI0025C273C5|nr:hypothetical protein [Clostridium sp.]
MGFNMLIRYVVSVAISALVFFTIIVNYNRMKNVVKNRLLIFFLVVVLVLVDIIIKILFGRESISATIIRSITYSVSMSIFIYLILSRKQKV